MIAATLVLLTSYLSPAQAELQRRGALGLGFTPLPAETASTLKLGPGQGLVAVNPLPGLTAEKAGFKEGDVLAEINGKPVGPTTVSAIVRETPAKQTVKFKIFRDGKPTELTAEMVEKPRDPGNTNYEVIYSHVVSNGKRMRTIITKPRKPGRYPGFFFVQGLSPVSYDFTLEGSTGSVQQINGPMLFEFANSGFVTMRVEKPGVGDSEGGPYSELDYTTELDIYRQALKQLKEQSGLDKDNVFIFGHSMGGAFGPMVAAENPVKGIATYGTAARTWFEYFLDILRYQGLVAGGSYENADDEVRTGAQLFALLFLEGKSVEDVKKSHPALAPYADGMLPGGLFNGKSLDFWRQLGKVNFATYWAKANARVLAVHGESDFVSYAVDHKLIADIVNKVHPGWGRYESLPESDHLFHDWKTEAVSQQNFGKGKYTTAFTKMMKDWMLQVAAEK